VKTPLDLAALYDAHASSLYRFLLAVTGNTHVTEDILQDIFCRLAGDPHCLAKVDNPRAYLLRWAHRAACDHWRHQARTRPLEPDLALPAETTPGVGSDFQQLVLLSLAALPREQSSVVHLKIWEHFTFEEIGRALDISANTAASRYRYGLQKLRAALRIHHHELR
jgi:RNA polymerase sigma-70 factor, ECF subfamily